MTRVRECQARVYGGDMQCHKCGLVWDINDPEPPECGTKDSDAQIKRIKRKLDRNVYTLVRGPGLRDLPFKSEWMAKEALTKALEGYRRGSYDLEPVLIGPNGEEVAL